MKQTTLILFIFFLFSGFAHSQQGWRPGEMEIKVMHRTLNPGQQQFLHRLNGEIYSEYALLYVTPEECIKLEREGIPYWVTKPDLNRYHTGFWENRDSYHNYYQIIALADSLEDHFPDICKKVSFGYSIQDRQLVALKISDHVEVDEPEAEIMFDGGIHGDELLGPEIIIRFARDLCLAYGTDPALTQLIDTREIWLYLMVNPDGTVAVSRYNANGVDINRDWGYMWDEWGGSSFPFSQVESRALRECMYTNQFVVHTSYHAGTEFLSYPWSYRADPAPDQEHIHSLATVYVDSSLYPNLEYGQGYSGMYAINGSTKDSNYGLMGSISWSMEISMDKQPSPSQIELYYLRNKPAMIATIEYGGYGIQGTVTDATTGEPVPAIVLIDNSYQVFTDPVVGDYHKYLVPGTYPVKVLANGYESQLIENVSVASLSVNTLDVELEPGGGHFVYRIGSCQIPGNNAADEGNTVAVFGPSDHVNYSIGKSGWIVLDMQEPITDGPGEDFTVYEGDSSPEGYTCFCSQTPDGPWALIGEGEGTTGFDLAVAGMGEAQFIKITDDGDGTAVTSNAGFDLDAVEVMAGFPGVYLTIIHSQINDLTGNQNGRIDPGEECELSVTLKNSGNALASAVTGALGSLSPFITITTDMAELGDIPGGETAEAQFNLSCDALTPQGYVWLPDFTVQANAGGYTDTTGLACPVGEIAEDWESGDFSSFNWQQLSTSHWTVTPNNPYEGLYCARSGVIGDNQATQLALTMEVTAPGTISFFRKVSSESGYDFLEFFIDNTLADRWSGSESWQQVSYVVLPGNHTFTWSYSKDVYSASGSDCGWIDRIVFPPHRIPGSEYIGTVSDCSTGQPLGFTMLTFTNLETGEIQSVQTEPTGSYSAVLSVGNVQIIAELEGFEILCDTVVVYSGETVPYDLCLNGAIGMAGDPLAECRIYPNPFSSQLHFMVPHQDNKNILLIISNINGKLIRILAGIPTEGPFTTLTWDGKDQAGEEVPAGTYVYTLSSGSATYTGKVVHWKE